MAAGVASLRDLAVEFGDEGRERQLGVAGDADLGLDVLVEIDRIKRGVDVALFLRHAGGERRDRKTAADAEDQIGVVEEVIHHA